MATAVIDAKDAAPAPCGAKEARVHDEMTARVETGHKVQVQAKAASKAVNAMGTAEAPDEKVAGATNAVNDASLQPRYLRSTSASFRMPKVSNPSRGRSA